MRQSRLKRRNYGMDSTVNGLAQAAWATINLALVFSHAAGVNCLIWVILVGGGRRLAYYFRAPVGTDGQRGRPIGTSQFRNNGRSGAPASQLFQHTTDLHTQVQPLGNS
jgi:hypothetical protein